MKVVILAGGKGTRISQLTHKIPKPMIRIGNIPMLTHIMRIFKSYGFDDFVIAGGYKIHVIKKYYKNSKEFKKLKIVFTGSNTMTGGRILKLKNFLKEEEFFMTYGDGISNVDLNKLLAFHKKNKKIATVTAVRPPVKFGELDVKKDSTVKSFVEKPKVKQGWINGGFFVLDKKIFDYIKKPSTVFEAESLAELSKKKQLKAFKHKGFWKCMDNLSEKIELENIYKEDKNYGR
jgi:glucose-1-phosphate cytidylyltransferase